MDPPMKTSHKSDELKFFKKGRGVPQIGYLWFKWKKCSKIYCYNVLYAKKLTVSGDEYINIFLLQCLEQYMNEVKSGMTSKEDIEPTIVKETEATALVDGNNVIGMI